MGLVTKNGSGHLGCPGNQCDPVMAETSMKDLCHHIRNATSNIAGIVKKIPDPATRLKLLEQAMRIEQALFQYEGRVKNGEQKQSCMGCSACNQVK